MIGHLEVKIFYSYVFFTKIWKKVKVYSIRKYTETDEDFLVWEKARLRRNMIKVK